MTLTNLLIIYLAFGAPLAVYKYLQNRPLGNVRRVLVSSFTFLFWLPAAFELGSLYLTNAYSDGAFVSHRILDADSLRLSDMRESMSCELIKLARGLNLHDLRETVDRYVGLSQAVRNSTEAGVLGRDLFQAAGRREYDLGEVCLTRRNLHRLRRHHVEARQDFVGLFRQIGCDQTRASRAMAMGTDLARQLGDGATLAILNALKTEKSEVWDTQRDDRQTQAITASPSIVMTASLNSD